MFYSKFLNFLKKRYIISQFKHFSIVGNHFSVLSTARCINMTNDKGRILIGNNVELGCRINVSGEGKIMIGDNTTIRYNSELLSTAKITIGNNVIISNNCIIYDNNTHPVSPIKRLEMTKCGFYSELWDNSYAEKKEVVIGDNVWVCQRVMIMKGVTIGKGAVIAAGAVVTKDIPEYCIAAGNPATVVKIINKV